MANPAEPAIAGREGRRMPFRLGLRKRRLEEAILEGVCNRIAALAKRTA